MVQVRIAVDFLVGLRGGVMSVLVVSLGNFGMFPTSLTTGKTQGFALSSLYAPMPRSTLFGSVSRRYAAIKPKRGSSGA